jgi:hypothetical protein
LKVKSLFTQRPYAARMAPRSRRDKDMSDDKTINITNWVSQEGRENAVFPILKMLTYRVIETQ